MKPILHIVICSTRPGRVGPAIAPNEAHAGAADTLFNALYRWTQAMKPMQATA